MPFPALCSLPLLLFCLVLQGGGVLACPRACVCGTNQEFVMCQGGIFGEIEPQLGVNLQELVLEQVSGLESIKGNFLSRHGLRLKSLTIRKCSVQTVESYAFTNLKALTKLDLSQNNLLSLETNTFEGLENLRTLNLAKNKLSGLKEGLSPMVRLKILDLTHNALQDISSSVFLKLSALTNLTLDNNPLKQLKAKYFSGLNSLLALRLRDCSLQSIHMDVFYSLPKLVFLDLGQNRLSEPLSPGVIVDLKYLTLLYDHNELQRLEDKDFFDLNLLSLDLSYNRINYIQPTAFQNLIVQSLDLSYNLILSLSTEFLSPLSGSLQSLDLSGNPLEKIDVDSFPDFPELRSLNLSSCSLDVLEAKTLSSLKNPITLDISKNNLHFLSPELLSFMDKMAAIYLDKNSWICDCRIKPLAQWLNKNRSRPAIHGCLVKGYNFQNCSQLQCAAPSQLLRRPLVMLQDKELGDCIEDNNSSGLPASTQGAIVAACLGFSIIFLIITIYLWRKGKTSFKLKRVCMPSHDESSHMIDEDAKVPPLSNCDRASLNESDHEFVVRHYFDTLVTDPKLMSRTSDTEEPTSPKERDSMYSSQPSLYSNSAAPMGIESTV